MKEKKREMPEEKKYEDVGRERQTDRVGTTPYGSQDLNSKTWD